MSWTEGTSGSVQPPGQWHEVYTPQRSITMGGHLRNVILTPLSETSLYYDLREDHIDTNFDHPSAFLTFMLMVNGLKYNERDGMSLCVFISIVSDTLPVYPRKSLAALCRIVLHAEEYFDHPFEKVDVDLANYRLANATRGERVEHLKKRIPRMPDHARALKNASMLVKRLKLDQTIKVTARGKLTKDYILETGLMDFGEDVNISKLKVLLE